MSGPSLTREDRAASLLETALRYARLGLPCLPRARLRHLPTSSAGDPAMSDDLLDKLARKDPKAAARLRKAGAAIVHAPGQLVLVRGNGGDGHADTVGNGAAPPPEGPGPHAPLD